MACCKHGPGYSTPLEAMTKGPRETLLYIPCVVPDHSRPDYLVTVDVDPNSPSYSQVIYRTNLLHKGDEPHHSGWNSCSGCYYDDEAERKYLVLPCLGQPRIYAIDVTTDPRAPKIGKVVEPEDVKKAGVSYLHTSHCLANGEIMVSGMGDGEGKPSGKFLLLDQDFKIKGTWADKPTKYGYDFWYQPKHNVMVSSSWGDPGAFSKGFDPSLVGSHYGDQLTFWDWKKREPVQEVHLGQEGLIPLEVRFLHNPSSPHGYVGAALSSNVIHFTKDEANGSQWKTKVAIRQPWAKVEGWVLPELPPLITDILISLDDKFIYFSNWLRGDVVQYDISDPEAPKFVSRCWLGGVLRRDSPVKPLGEGLPEGTPAGGPLVPDVKGTRLEGGPQMLQLSLDGKRLYVTNSLYSPWDKQFYPDMANKGSYLLQLDVTPDGLRLNPNFLIDFGLEPDGPVLAHEVRYPGGDCSSDIFP